MTAVVDSAAGRPERIVSLLPAATEIVAALGLEGALVGRSHECDEPESVSGLPALTAAAIDAAGTSRAIHEAVGAACTAAAGSPPALFRLDTDMLATLRPDVIVTQAACDVCAVSADDVTRAARSLGRPVPIVALAPTSLADLWRDIRAVAAATGTLPRGREVVARLQARCRSVACRVEALARSTGGSRPRVAVVEWLDPPMAAGNWVPELVTLAGGDDVLGRTGHHSHWIGWEDVARADPDVVILAPCGFTRDRTVAEATTSPIWNHLAPLRATRAGRLFVVDGHHLLNRPGPRLVDSLEVIAQLLHPGRFEFPATQRHAARLGDG
jgi:iron complex transport system substrate-binding protein